MKWKQIPDYPDYEVSDQGQVRSLVSHRILRPGSTQDGKYQLVGLTRNGKRSVRSIHRLVLEAFVGPRPKGMEARHFPDRTSNALKNLSWATKAINQGDRWVGRNNLGRDTKNHLLCPACNQPMPIERAGVRMSPLKSRIFDLVESAREEGISTDALIARVMHDMSPNTLKSHISQINDMLETEGLQIVSRGHRRFLEPLNKRACI